MPQRAFLRYRLQNSIRMIPDTLSLFEAALETDRDTLSAYLAELDALKAEAVARLRENHAEAIALLRGKRVLFLGDSLTADEIGYRPFVTEAAGLVARNGAISGATTSSLLHICRQRLYSKGSPVPDVVSIMLGTNDSVSIEREELYQVSPAEYERNMREILTWARKIGTRVLLFEIPPVLEAQFCAHARSNAKLQSNRSIHAYNSILRKLADGLGAVLIAHDLPDGDVALYEEDGLHLSVKGQELLAAHWLESAASLLR